MVKADWCESVRESRLFHFVHLYVSLIERTNECVACFLKGAHSPQARRKVRVRVVHFLAAVGHLGHLPKGLARRQLVVVVGQAQLGVLTEFGDLDWFNIS